MAAAKTKKYIVTQKGTCLKGTEITKVGTKVNLTDAKAAAMVGKVRLLEDYEADNRSDSDLKKENATLTKQLDEATGKVAALDEANAALVTQVDEATGKVAALDEANAALVTQVETLTALLPAKDKK